MTDTINSETIETLAAKLADFSKGLSSDEQIALDRFFLQSVDSGSDVQGFGIVDGSSITVDAGNRTALFSETLLSALVAT